MEEKIRSLIMVGAAFASGAAAQLDEYVKRAKNLGATPEELSEVLTIARSVKLAGAMEIDAFAEACVREPQKIELKILVPSGSACGCGPEGC